MAYRRIALAVGEWFHCYTRTIDHSRPFDNAENAERFLETLYLANQHASMPKIPELRQKYSHDEIFLTPRAEPLVLIGAYSVMPTHYHIEMMPAVENGISDFLHKVGTGFTKFYNNSHKRIGNLFIKPFRSKHIDGDGYFGRAANYIHLNHLELYEQDWKRGNIRHSEQLKKKLLSYPYSSLLDYEGIRRPQRNILANEAFEAIQENLSPLEDAIKDAAEYYRFLDMDL